MLRRRHAAEARDAGDGGLHDSRARRCDCCVLERDPRGLLGGESDVDAGRVEG